MSWRLRVDWPLCEGRGLCHELAPDSITLDDWGYPIFTTDVPHDQLGDVREAVRGCPQLALRLIKDSKAKDSKARDSKARNSKARDSKEEPARRKSR